MDKKAALKLAKTVLTMVFPLKMRVFNLAEEIVDFEWNWNIRMTKQKTGHPPKMK